MLELNSLSMYLLGFIAFALILAWYIKTNRTYWQKRGVSTIPGHWLFGNVKNVIKFETSPSVLIGDLYHQASDDDDVLGIYIFHKPFLLLRNPEIIKQILIKDFNYFPNRYFTAKSFQDKIGSSNLFTVENPEWRYLRTKISPVFTSGKIKRVFELIVETANMMSKYLSDQFATGPKTRSVLIKDIATRYTTDIISSVAFGIQVNSFDPENTKFFDQAQKGIKMTLQRGLQFLVMFFFPKLSPYIGGQMLGVSTNYFRKVFWNSMDNRELSKYKRGDLIDTLLELKNEKQDKDFKFEGDVLVSQSAIFFVAGRESSVTTISFTLYELAKYPEIQKKARNEILEKIQEHGMTYDAVQNMKYLYQVLSETLRLYPAAPLIDRVAVADYKIPGTDVVIEKGTPVYVALCGLHRDPKYYPDPLRFNPDRFSDENKDKIVPCTYMPFGEGPRICVGMRLGLLQSAMGVITILKDYEVSLDPTYKGMIIEPRNIFISPTEDLRLNLTKL